MALIGNYKKEISPEKNGQLASKSERQQRESSNSGTCRIE